MNCAVRNDGKRIIVVTGQESHSQMYLVNAVIEKEGDLQGASVENGTGPVRKRKNVSHNAKKSLAGEGNAHLKELTFTVKASDSIQTDFAEQEPLQVSIDP
jgi:prolactin regulatory element-binding protein